jgi:hypothetical protein
MAITLKNALVKNSVIRSWNPTDISGTYLWLDAADAGSVTLNGSNVSQWDDKSGNSRHFTQTTAGRQPPYIESSINGKNIIRTNGAFHYLAIANQPSIQDITFFMVQKYNGLAALQPTGNYPFSWMNGLSGSIIDWAFYVSNFAPKGVYNSFYRREASSPPTCIVSVGASMTDGNPHITSFTLKDNPASASVMTIYTDGSQVKTQSNFKSYNAASTNIYIGSAQGSLRFYSGDYCEFIIYDRVLTTAERQQVESYLSTKWGI